MRDLKPLGLKLALGDFGTGYTLLSYLKRLLVDLLKIDHPIIQELEEGDQGRVALTAIIHTAHTIGLNVRPKASKKPGNWHVPESSNATLRRDTTSPDPWKPPHGYS